ncbi:MAG: dynamin family protein [Anaerolineae bacterium]|nr:dynamin family protein [Anaerolineae bacterium]
MTTLTTTLEGPIAALRERTVELISDVAATLANEGIDAPDDVKRLQDVAQDLRNMFFIVAVIGEFNAGKSSFVNALLGEKLLPMGITPTTEYIELIRYNDVPDRTPTVRDNALREWAHPNTGAPGVAIVDTPGTGSVFHKHETIAKDFLHRSDLVVFVISAKHAFAETERVYLELAKRYGKKIILVVNQVDLLKQSEQSEVRRFIVNQVKETLELEPLIFMVSAKEALEALNSESPTSDAGNVATVRAHLRGVYAEAPPAKQKLMAQLDTTNRIIQNHHDGAADKARLVSTDIIKVQDVKKELEQQSLGLERRMKEAAVEIDTVLEGVRRRGMNFVDTHLTVRKLGRGLDRVKLQEEFEEVVIGRSLRDIGDAAEGYINAVVDQSRLYWRGVVDRLNRIQDLMEQEAGGLDKGIYAEQRESLQNAIRIAESELKSYSSGEIVTTMKNSFDTNMGNFQGLALMSVGGLAVALIAVLAPGPLIGAASGPFAPFVFAVGGAVALIAGIPAIRSVRRMTRQAKKEFNERIDELLKNYHKALDDLTKKERNRLNQYGNQVLTPVFSRLEVLSQRYENQQLKLEKLQREIKDLRSRIDDLK